MKEFLKARRQSDMQKGEIKMYPAANDLVVKMVEYTGEIKLNKSTGSDAEGTNINLQGMDNGFNVFS